MIDSITELFGGAECGTNAKPTTCSGSTSRGTPTSRPIYLPEGFIGHPLLKSYPLLAREVKPWPGDVDVEDMPEDPGEGADA